MADDADHDEADSQRQRWHVVGGDVERRGDAEDALPELRPGEDGDLDPEPLRLLGQRTKDVVQFMATFGYLASRPSGEPVVEPGFEDVIFRPPP